MAKLLMNCPQCGDSWGIEEMSFNECDSCNYPQEDWNNDVGYDDYFEGDVENMGLDKEADLANNEK